VDEPEDLQKQPTEDVVLDYDEQIIGVYGSIGFMNPKNIITEIGLIVWRPNI